MRLGCERLFDPEFKSVWKGRRLGIVTNYTGVDAKFRRTVDRLIEEGAHVVRLFTAEHGFYGVAQAGAHIESETDQKTGIEIVSLYGKSKDLPPEIIKDVDLLLFEFQDIGVRFYTYISTMFRVMKSASTAKVPFMVLDRPNPLGGMVEGAGVEEGFHSFVSEYNVPIRHGLTLGELAQLYKEENELELQLIIVPVEGWSRNQQFHELPMQWIPPSPNMPTYETAQIYPGTGFFEGTNVSEGRGTALPFQWIGAPWINGEKLADALNELHLPGVRFRPVAFQPTISKHQGVRVEGVQIHLVNADQLKPTYIGLQMIAAIKRLYPDHFNWLPPFNGRHFIDLLWGSSRYREELDQGRNPDEIWQEWQQHARDFEQRRKPYLIYQSHG